ncbi:hypothetical protein [Variovorax ginsengisoli]|uniref:HEPN domain-containing protein n=1 Tax=Variovorax ginsengisoli TaxID=363844 RepID=A0ABT8SGP1_9BURK|nr:hypothetical protein [Variovorax ginsengisoli]MDN8618921.1 hypothetical protein [Variovorax ginsengisoli]MDO1538091.1 hypothetical protein [Variovorax ginsengisoli]
MRRINAAERFFEAAERCGSRDRADIHKIGPWLPEPQIVAFAFAAEVALKGLQQVHNGTISGGHDLVKILGKLPEEVRSRLRFNSYSEAEFTSLLHEVQHAFEDWRYEYEKAGPRTVPPFFLKNLAAVAIAELRKTVDGKAAKSKD